MAEYVNPKGRRKSQLKKMTKIKGGKGKTYKAGSTKNNQ